MNDTSNSQVLVTRRGLLLLQAKLARAQEDLRSTQGQKGEAAEVGGNVWHDNFSFEELERRERHINWTITQIMHTLRSARVVEPPANAAVVMIGHRVKVSFEDGSERWIPVGGHAESDPASGVVAYDTPLGGALLGATVGEQRTFVAGGRERTITIEGIEMEGRGTSA